MSSVSDTIHYQQCPACQSAAIHHSFTAKDFTVTGESFQVWHCANCSLRFTQDVPDAAHIGRYYASQDYVSHSDTREGLVNQLYHRVRNYTLQAKRRLVQRECGMKTGALLDVGAGTGAFAHTMQQAEWNVTGLEPDATARTNAQERYSLSLLPPEQLYALADAQFNAITLWHVLEHVHDLHGYLATFRRLLKPGGRLIIAVPNYTSRDAAHYGPEWAAYDVPRHLYHFSPESMKKLARAKDFTVQRMHPMLFDSFYVSMLSEKYRTGNNRLPAAAWHGLMSNLRTFSSVENCSSVIYVLG